MFLSRSMFHALCLVLIQIIFLNVVKGNSSIPQDNATSYASSRESGRSKRSPLDDMPYEIIMKVAYSTERVMKVTLHRQSQFVANIHLPVFLSSGYPNPYVMKNIGDFVVYHDHITCSSVVYFKKLNVLYGFIGMDYYIADLPYLFDVNTGYYPYYVRAPYVMKRTNALIPIFPSLSYGNVLRNLLSGSSEGSASGIKRPLDSDGASTSKHQRTNRDLAEKNYAIETDVNVTEISHIRKRRWNPMNQRYYLETLVFVTRGVAEKFEKSLGVSEYIEWVVRYCIIYFSAVDMIFQKVRENEPRLRINIAKIVIEDGLEPFRFMKDNDFQFTQAVGKLRKDLSTHSRIYTPDSFDHVFTITSLPIKYDSEYLPGLTDYSSDLFEERKQGHFYDAVPISIVNYESDYTIAVREINRVLGITAFAPAICFDSDCCLEWSSDSEQQFSVFFRWNRNRCFLLNQPRSLRPPGPSIFLTPLKQCLCFGYDTYITMKNDISKNYVPNNECNAPLQCKKIDVTSSYYEQTVRVFDGTICGNRHKVCWNGDCIPFKSAKCNPK